MPRILIALIIAALGFSGLAEARSARHRATPRHRFVQVHGKRPQAHKRAMGKAAPAGAVMARGSFPGGMLVGEREGRL